MRIVIAFDVDGTLECGAPKGNIKLSTLLELKKRGFIVGIVGNYLRVPKEILQKLDFCYGTHPFKAIYLRKIKSDYKADLVIYVADDELDRRACLVAKVIYVHPQFFNI